MLNSDTLRKTPDIPCPRYFRITLFGNLITYVLHVMISSNNLKLLAFLLLTFSRLGGKLLDSFADLEKDRSDFRIITEVNDRSFPILKIPHGVQKLSG